MKILNISVVVYLIFGVSSLVFSQNTFKRVKYKLYKDSELTLRGHNGDAGMNIFTLGKSDSFESLNLFIWNSFNYKNVEIDRKIQCFCSNEKPKVVKRYKVRNRAYEAFTIPKKELISVAEKCVEKKFVLIYSDLNYARGIGIIVNLVD